MAARIFGITGGIGMGKSTVGDLLVQRGIPIIDSDAIARQVVEPASPALGEVVERFGQSVLKPDGTLNRQELAGRVFPDERARADLEAILHPRIHAIWTAQVQRWREDASVKFGAVIIPLLFEIRSESLFDAVICVACSEGSQRGRLRKRNWTDEQVEQRARAQLSIDQKITRSAYMLWTDTPIEVVGEQLDMIIKRK